MTAFKRLSALVLALILVLGLAACGAALPSDPAVSAPGQSAPVSDTPSGPAVERDGWYYDLENVILYLDAYGELPPNFITKDEARDLGWNGGPVEPYLSGGAIGGDRFGNREGILPGAPGRSYTECDLYTYGMDERGARRLVFSNDGLYFYTEDHYDSFTEYYVAPDGTVKER